MTFIVFFIVALLSLFGFGQVIGARNQETNFSRRLYDRFAGKNKDTWKERLEQLRHPEGKKRSLFSFLRPKKRLNWFQRVIMRRKE